MRILILVAVCLAPASLASDGSCADHLAFGDLGGADQILCRNGYALGYSYSRKGASWVAYRLTPEIHDSTNVDRQDDFRADGELPAQYRTTPEDYDEPVYD